jgi:hypothetical protein
MRVQPTAVATAAALTILCTVLSAATPTADPFDTLNAIPALPTNVASAGTSTHVGAVNDRPPFTAPAYDAVDTRITAAVRPAASVAGMTGSAGGIDFARASSDPAYAAQVQARMQTMTMEEKMAMANQMRASAQASMGDPRAMGAIAGFLGGQRSADIAAQQKIRTLLDGALGSVGAQHRAIDEALGSAAKACPADKTGWPLASCTGPLGVKSLAQHRTVEEASLGKEAQAFAQARAIALAELNKGRDLFSNANGVPNPSLVAWAMVYVQMLNDYGKAITLRAGFWAHADASKYTGQVTAYIQAQGGEIAWPLRNSGYGESTAVGL